MCCSTCTASWCTQGNDCKPWVCAHYPHGLFFASNATRPHWRRRFSCLHQVPIHALKEKAKLYVDQGLIRQEMAERVIRVIESERGDSFYVNDVQPADAQDAAAGGGDSLSTRLSPEQMQALLAKRVEMMKQGQVRDEGNGAVVTDQFRVYSYIVSALEQGRPLRLMVQASAGTGTVAFSITTVGDVAIRWPYDGDGVGGHCSPSR